MSNDWYCFACGSKFRSAISEARHRHNFPVLCKRNKQFKKFCDEIEAKKRKEQPDNENHH